MNIYAAVYTFNRPKVMEASLLSVFANTLQPEFIDIIDNASNGETTSKIIELCSGRTNVGCILKNENLGATHSGRMALAKVRATHPRYFFQIESDYIFKPHAFAKVIDVFEKTEHGRMCAGIVGYDAPHYYSPLYRNHIFPDGMQCQVGENNVNWRILHRPFVCGPHILEFVSNTHPTCYLHWDRIEEIASEFPQLNRLLDEVYDPQENKNYPTSAEYRKKRYIDDGMLSHAVSLYWNKWSIKHGINREEYAAWLNIKPSIAQNINGGGDHSTVNEMSTDNGSPSWQA